MTYISQDAPALAKKPEEHNDDTVTQDAWDKLFESVLESQEFYEFHVYKVSQVFSHLYRDVIMWLNVCSTWKYLVKPTSSINTK